MYSTSVPMLLFVTAFPNTRTCTAPVQHELVNLDFVEFSYVDDVLAEMKITPDKIEIPIPAYFKRDRANELEYWDNLLKATAVNIEFRLNKWARIMAGAGVKLMGARIKLHRILARFSKRFLLLLYVC